LLALDMAHGTVQQRNRKGISFTSSPPYGEVTSKDSLIIQSNYINKIN